MTPFLLSKKTETTANKIKRSKILLIGFAGFIALSALAGLVIGIDYLIRSAQTATSSNMTSTTFTLRWQAAGITVAGTGIAGSGSDRLYYPTGITIDSSNSLYIADQDNNRIQKFSPGSSLGVTVAGQPNGMIGSNSIELYHPNSVVLDSSGNIYVSDTSNHRVQLFPNGSFIGMTIAGTGSNGSSINELTNPHGLALNPISGALYIADYGNHRVMSYLSNVSSVVAGGNGPGSLNTQLNFPQGLTFDLSSNSLYIANSACHNIVRWVLNASTWTLVAGSPTCSVGSTSLMLYYPMNVILDPMGNVYVTDCYNQRIQLFQRGMLNGTTIAGATSTTGSLPNELNYPYSLAFDSDFNLYVADIDNHRIQKFLRY